MSKRNGPEKFRQENLLIADFQGPEKYYANAILWEYMVVTAWHVASANPLIISKHGEIGKFLFRQIHSRDLAVSINKVPNYRGYSRCITPEIGSSILVCGYHGKSRAFFEIEAKVVRIDQDGRIVVEAIPMSGKKLFQLGMSGSPAVTTNDEIIGILTAEAKGNFKGHRVYLEPAWELR